MLIKRRVYYTAIFLCALLGLPPQAPAGEAAARKLRFLYEPGARYRIVIEVNENVFVNGVHSNTSYILNKSSVNTAEVQKGSGRLDCDFQMSERLQGRFNAYILKQDYHSVFWRDELGVYTIDPSYFMPVVRNLPRFPDGAVKPGDTWSGDAAEVHDLRRGYGIPYPLHFPVKAHYTYLRDEVKDGVNTAVLKVEYTTFHGIEYRNAPVRPAPVKITGTSAQTLWWDIAAGRYHSSHEEFDYIFFLSNASHVEYRGIADGRLLRSPALDRDAVVDSLNKKLKEEKIADTEARKDKKGVTIVMENVNFPPYSPELTGTEREKLSRIASILKQFPERDFLITGHTARVGEERTSQALSEQRAQAVADYLISRGACGRARVMTQGKGSREPAADNATEEGRRKNRRVEITILEN